MSHYLSSRLFRFVLCCLVTAGWMAASPSAHVFAQDEADSAEPAEPLFERPAYQVLRDREDWSGLAGHDRATTGDFFDPIKYVPLFDNGSVWVSFGGQIRTRLEGWNNFNFGAPAGAKRDDLFLLTRLLFHADLHVGEYLRAFVQGKSAFATDRDLIGGRRPLDTDELDLQNGFVDLKLPIGDRDSLTLRAGRQELLFGRQRLVSPLDWSNTRRTFDGFSGILKIADWQVTGFWTQLVEIRKYEFNPGDAQTTLFGAYAAGKVPTTSIGLDLYWLGHNRTDNLGPAVFNGTTGSERRHTFGGRVHQKLPLPMIAGTFDYDLEGAYQTGTVGDGDIDAFMVALQVGYAPDEVWSSPRFFVGFDYASGDRGAGGDVQTFNQTFPLGHAYLGWLDQIGRQNIVAMSTGVTFTPARRLTVDLHGHLFWRAESTDGVYNVGGAPFRAPVPGASREIGSELDLLLKYQYDRHAELMFGYSRFFAGKFIEQTGPSKDIDFIYAAVQYTF